MPSICIDAGDQSGPWPLFSFDLLHAYVPHRPPILCIDEVRSVDETRASCARRVRDEASIAGELWEPWLIEGLAQTAAVLKSYGSEAAGRRVDKGIRYFVTNELQVCG